MRTKLQKLWQALGLGLLVGISFGLGSLVATLTVEVFFNELVLGFAFGTFHYFIDEVTDLFIRRSNKKAD